MPAITARMTLSAPNGRYKTRNATATLGKAAQLLPGRAASAEAVYVAAVSPSGAATGSASSSKSRRMKEARLSPWRRGSPVHALSAIVGFLSR